MIPAGTRVRVTHQPDPNDAPVGTYIVESYQATPELPIIGETFTPVYWLAIDDEASDGMSYTAPVEAVVPCLEVVR